MRSYGRSFLRGAMEQQAQARQETRDGMLWDMLPAQRLCRVKIQGSEELIVAHYPENWEQNPSWLKPGNAVRIVHRGGVRGRIEVVGHGNALPTTVAGLSLPTPATPQDAILSGCEVVQIPAGPMAYVMVTTGTYRIGGVIYSLPEIRMDSNTNYTMAMGGQMGRVAAIIPVALSVPAGSFREDIFVVGTDAVVDKVAGANYQTIENRPETPGGHLLLNHVLVYNGMTGVSQGDIGKEFHPPEPTSLRCVFNQLGGQNYGAWPVAGGGSVNGYSVTVTMLDQYGNALKSTDALGWEMKMECLGGTTTIYSEFDTGKPSSTSAVTVQTASSASHTWLLGAADALAYAALKVSIPVAFGAAEFHFVIPS